jgi:transcription elongation factor GreA
MDDTTLMTAADRAALEAELEQLEVEGRREIAERIRVARQWGDLSENSEYHDAKNDQAHLETKIVRLRERLARSKVVETENSGVVGLGSIVHVRDEEGREQRFEIASSQAAAPGQGRISIESPVARALLGQAPGAEVTVALPRGSRTYVVLGVD